MSSPRPFVVGVTGTNGKTSTTTWASRALRALGGPVARVTTLGFFIDEEPVVLPQTWAGFLEGFARHRAAGGRFAAVEYTSYVLARGQARAFPADVAVFTNFTRDHLDDHGTPEHYLASKAQLFAALPPGGVAVLNRADPAAELLAEVVPRHARVVGYAVRSRLPAEAPPALPADTVVADDVVVDAAGTRATLSGGRRGALALPVHGEIYVENALAAALGAEAAGVPWEAALAAVQGSAAPAGRFEVLARDPWVVVDYAHTPDALERSLRTARALTGGRVSLVFGAGGQRDREKRPLMGLAARGADRVVLTSDNPRREDPAEIAAAVAAGIGAHPGLVVEPDRARAIALAVAEADAADVVLVAGKGHEQTQEQGGTVRPFSDAEVALAAHRARFRAGTTA